MTDLERFERDLHRFLGFPCDRATALALVVGTAKRQLIHDVLDGSVPVDVSGFSELHSTVDANYYGNAFHWHGDFGSDHDTKFWNDVQNRVDDWIVAGGLKQSFLGGFVP